MKCHQDSDIEAKDDVFISTTMMGMMMLMLMLMMHGSVMLCSKARITFLQKRAKVALPQSYL